MPLRIFVQGTLTPLPWFCLASSDIHSWEDVKGKKIIVRSKASAVCMVVNPVVFEAFGIDIEKDFTEFPLEGAVAATHSVRDGIVDLAGSWPAFPPASYILDVAESKPLRMLPIDKPQVDEICAKLPFLHPVIHPGGIYKGVDEDVPTVGYLFLAFTRADVPDSLVYELTKAIYENIDDFKAFHPQLSGFSPEAVNLVSCPPHAGAIKYYKEIGVWSDEMDAKVKGWLKQMGVEK